MAALNNDHILLDANILLAYVDSSNANHATVKSKIAAWLVAGKTIFVCPQVLREAFGVMTRPASARGGLGWSEAKARTEIKRLETDFALQKDIPDVFDNWSHLVNTIVINGKQVHDANLVACMLAHQIGNIYTYNVADFNRYNPMITILT